MNKNTLLSIFLIISIAFTMIGGFIGYAGTLAHLLIAVTTSVLLVVKLFHMRRWMQHAGEAVKSGKAGDHTKRTYLLSIFLFKIWFLTIISGIISFLRNIGYTTALEGINQVHGITAMVATGLTVAYVINHFYNKIQYKKGEKKPQ